MNLEKINVGGNEYDICDAKTRAMVSDEYDPEGDYVAGDLCIHDNKLHEAKGPTTGAWDSTKWEGRTLAEVLKSQNSKIEGINSKSTAYEGSDDAYYAYFVQKSGLNFVNGNAEEAFSIPSGDTIVTALAQPIQANTVVLTGCNIISSNTIRLTVRMLEDGSPYEGSGIGFINYVLCVKKS